MQRKPTKILAEMACAHEGNVDLALKIMAGAATAGADAIQLQLFSAAHLVSPLSESFEAAKSFEISSKHWREIILEGKRRGLEVWANVFDEDMVALALEEGCARLKLHSTDLGNPRMLDVVGQSGKAVSLGTGGSTLDEIGYAVHQLESKGCSDMVLMHGFQAYPTDPKDCNLSFLKTLREIYGYSVGYQDHTDGGDELAHILPLIAIGYGADVLEKHITWSRSVKGIDYESSLDPEGFNHFVNLVRIADQSVGIPYNRPLTDEEKVYRKRMKRVVCTSQMVKKGKALTDDMLVFLRAEGEYLPDAIGSLLGRRATRDLPTFIPLKVGDVL